MDRLKLITKYFVRNALDEMFGNNKIKPGFIIALMLFTVSMLSLPFTLMVATGYEVFHAMGQEGILLVFILSLGSTIAFFFGIYTIMNVFYFSEDIEVILPLPFKSSEIIFGKFMAVLINMYVYTGMLVLPLITYGIVSKATLLYYIYGLIVLIITPIIPMILAALICMALMRFTSLSKHKDAFRMITGCIALLLIVAFNFFNSNANKNMDPKQFSEKLTQGNNNAIDMINGIFITNKFSAYSLLYNGELRGLAYMLVALALSLALFSVYYFVGGKLYFKGIVGVSEAYSKRENILENGEVNKLININSPIKALVKRDIKIIFRTPQLFINSVAVIFYMPAILLMGFLSNGDLSYFQTLLSQSSDWYGIAIVIAFIGGTTCVMTGGAAMTALSREGKDFIVSKYIPVNYKTQLYSKILSSFCINEIGTLVVGFLLIAVKANLVLFTLSMISSFESILLITLLGLYLDFRSPKLEWENEKEMLKTNYLVLLIMFLIFVLGAILVITALIIKNYIIIFGICTTLVLVGSCFLYRRLIKHAYKIYNDK